MFSPPSPLPFPLAFRISLRVNAGSLQGYSFDIVIALSSFKRFLSVLIQTTRVFFTPQWEDTFI